MEFYKEVGNVIYTFDELLNALSYINDEKQLKLIKMAYMYANKLHYNQKRKSGEKYIVHPLNVAYIAASYKLDYETICAALLHDVVEDTSLSLDDLSSLFGERIALLVDGVTKITGMSFGIRNDSLKVNQNKILHGMCQDVRILFIKLADRLHNMRTMSSMKPQKQLQKSNETYELYVPLAYRYGLYRIKEELEDISFYYRDKDNYKKVYELLNSKREEFYKILTSMKQQISTRIKSFDKQLTIDEEVKNIHGVYRRLNMGVSLENMHDLLSLKIVVDSIPDCYFALGILHSMYNHVDSRFKDYLFTPKSNNYRSLHTVLFSGTDYLVQARIRTPEMNKYANCGILSYYQSGQKIENEEIRNKLLDEFAFFRELVAASSFDSNIDVRSFVQEQFAYNITVYTPDGRKIELPNGSTPIDFAFRLGDEYAIHMVGAFANNRPCSFGYKLRDGDIVKIIKSDDKSILKSSWIHQVKTSNAREKIKQLTKKN